MRTIHDLRPLRHVALAALVCLLAPAVRAQIGPGPFAAFPTADSTDGKFLGFSCPSLSSFEEGVSMGVEIPIGETSFTLSIFDGETGGMDGAGKRHWDLGSRQLMYRLYADPLRNGNSNAANLVGEWTGNAANPLSGPGWVATSSQMVDNGWWGVTVDTAAAAQAPSGNYNYHLRIDADANCLPGEQFESNIKVAASNPLSFLIPRFGLVGGMRVLNSDAPILYPGGFPPPDGFLVDDPTTYDGIFEFSLQLPPASTDLRIFDGDFDHGTGSLSSQPYALTLVPCLDTDDPDTPADYTGFPFTVGPGVQPEGVIANPSPADDNFLDLYRRGEPGDPQQMGCVRYEVRDPNGVLYRNDNPSGGQEWEQFRIASALADNPGLSDYQVADDHLPAGEWRVRIVGLDLANLNFLFIEEGACSNVDGETVCPGPIYLVGDTVWLDANANGVQDPGEPGIPGVVLELRDGAGYLFGTTVTGDTSAADWANCVANNTGLDTQGLYCFGIDDPGAYTVLVAMSNFAPGGPLAGLQSTTGGEQQSDTVVDDNVLTYDFGYDSPSGDVGTGTIGYWKNHPEAWPLAQIDLGLSTFTQAEALALLAQPSRGDMVLLLAWQLIAARLNLAAGTDPSCIQETVAAADAFIADHPIGSTLSSAEKQQAEELKDRLDAYNNGRLCAPHRG